jgi:FAD/FMN-containing dehydrogenase/Fe-S oxidoreductase
MNSTAMGHLEPRLKSAIRGEALFDAYTRGRYATDASHYQIMPLGVVIPRDENDLATTLAIARDEGVSVVARGGGTSQCGQTVNDGLVVDMSKYMNHIIAIDASTRRCTVQPGIVLDELNRILKPHGLWFPVDVSTASRATIGGMTGNNSCGTRSIRYGTMRDNVLGIHALLADGHTRQFSEMAPAGAQISARSAEGALLAELLALGRREQGEIRASFPRLLRRVGGYNIDALMPGELPINLSHLLVGSEGTLALSLAIELKLSPMLNNRAVGVCHFGRFYDAMEASQHLVQLDPVAVELMDLTMIALATANTVFEGTVRQFVRGEPEAVLIVEFAEEDAMENRRRLQGLVGLMNDLGFQWERGGSRWGGVVTVEEPGLQVAITEVRQAALNIMMSMKEQGKPVSFVEDCAVPLEHLAEYTESLNRIFEKHGTRGTWYAHASVGCLHVRPVLNLKLDKDVKAMRSIAEETFALVRHYKGSHSGEHGDGIVRSEFHEAMFGARIVSAFETVKRLFDPDGVLNPGKIVNPPKMDDRQLLRYGPAYQAWRGTMALDWSDWSADGQGDGFQRAVEMCNNNGACRKLDMSLMCPSYRVTRDERDVTRGRANTLRLALSGQLGPEPLSSDAMYETMKLCVSCKGCRRECPTGVDMAKMKIEVLAARAARKGLSMRDRLIAYLPRYAPVVAKMPWLTAIRDHLPGLPKLSEHALGFAAGRPLPSWSPEPFSLPPESGELSEGREVVLFSDTFSTYFEPENLRAAAGVLDAAGYHVRYARSAVGDGKRPLCCGRTFLSAGLVEEARVEARRLIAAFTPFVKRGVPVIGLEPSCLFTLRDELISLVPGTAARSIARQSFTLEEFLAREIAAGRSTLKAQPLRRKAYLHGHCHQKAFGAMSAVRDVLKLIPNLETVMINSSCCGMAGAFGYQAETYEASQAMAERDLLPAVRAAEADAILIADGISCRQQILHGSGRRAVHATQVLQWALAGGSA